MLSNVSDEADECTSWHANSSLQVTLQGQVLFPGLCSDP